MANYTYAPTFVDLQLERLTSVCKSDVLVKCTGRGSTQCRILHKLWGMAEQNATKTGDERVLGEERADSVF